MRKGGQRLSAERMLFGRIDLNRYSFALSFFQKKKACYIFRCFIWAHFIIGNKDEIDLKKPNCAQLIRCIQILWKKKCEPMSWQVIKWLYDIRRW